MATFKHFDLNPGTPRPMRTRLMTAALAVALAFPAFAAGEKPARKPSRSMAEGSYGEEDLIARTVFQALVGDIALQRGDTAVAISAWVDLARRTRDPKVIARAIEITAGARQFEQALELTRLWLEVEPDSAKARQTESSLLLLANRTDDLAPQLSQLLEQDRANLPANLMQLNRILHRHTDKQAIQRLVDRVAMPYVDIPEAHFAMGLAALNADDDLRAQNEFSRALQLRPDWEAAAIARAQVLARHGNAGAIASLEQFLASNPNAKDARLTLARLLIVERRYDEANTQFTRLRAEAPDDPVVIYPAAILALQQEDLDTSRQLLEKLLASDFKDKTSLHYVLGQIDEQQKRPEAAIEHFTQVTGGDQYVAARARAAQILMQQGKSEEARKLLHVENASAEEQAQLAIAEAQILREAGRAAEGYALLEAALERQPDNPELLYETALTAERQGQPDVMEKHLRRLLEIKPEHAHALNALGYSYADRNVRLAEAQALIDKARALAPDDPFIMDSAAWVLFRQGKNEEALKMLETAYRIKADPEIAAHLGEVLWTLGRKDDARTFLRDAATKFPDSAVLAEALRKFAP